MQEKQNSTFRIIVECDKDFENLPMLCRTLDQQVNGYLDKANEIKRLI